MSVSQDSTINNLEELITPQNGDMIAIVDNGVGGLTKRIDFENLLKNIIADSIITITLEVTDLTITGTLIFPVTEISTSTTINDAVIIGVNTPGITVTIDTDAIVDGRQFYVKDQSGGAATNNITIVGEGGELIDGLVSASIVANYGATHLYALNGALWTLPETNTSSGDEFGNDGNLVGLRKLSDFTTLHSSGNFYVVSRDIGSAFLYNTIFVDKPLIFTANAGFVLDFFRNPNAVLINGVSNDAFLQSLPMKSNPIIVFSDGGSGTTNVESTAHGLNTGDLVKVQDSRITEYNGNHLVTVIDANNFTIPIPFDTVDGQCKWTQVNMEATLSAGSGVVNLNITNHGFATDDWINLEGSDIDGTYQITVLDDDNFTIAATFDTSTTGQVDTSPGVLEFFGGFIPNVGTNSKFCDIQGSLFHQTVLVVDYTFLIGPVEGGELRDLRFFGLRLESGLFDVYGFKCYDIRKIFQVGSASLRDEQPFTTSQYLSTLEMHGSETRLALEAAFTAISGTLNESFLFIDPAITEDGRVLITNNGDNPAPSVYFKEGYFARANSVITDGGGGTIDIAISDTSSFRVGDPITLLETSSYGSSSGTVQSIVSNTSINVDIAFTSLSTATTGTVDDNGDGTINMAVTTTTGFLAGDYVLIAGTTPNYDGIFQIVQVVDSTTIKITATHLGDITVQGTVTANSRALVKNTDVTQVSLDQTDRRVITANNTALQNSMTLADVSFRGTINVDIGDTAGDYTIINGTIWIADGLERVTVDSETAGNGRLKYDGIDTDQFSVSYAAQVDKTTAGTQTYGLVLIKNSQTTPEVVSTNVETVELSASIGKLTLRNISTVTLATGDTLDLAVMLIADGSTSTITITYGKQYLARGA